MAKTRKTQQKSDTGVSGKKPRRHMKATLKKVSKKNVSKSSKRQRSKSSINQDCVILDLNRANDDSSQKNLSGGCFQTFLDDAVQTDASSSSPQSASIRFNFEENFTTNKQHILHSHTSQASSKDVEIIVADPIQSSFQDVFLDFYDKGNRTEDADLCGKQKKGHQSVTSLLEPAKGSSKGKSKEKQKKKQLKKTSKISQKKTGHKTRKSNEAVSVEGPISSGRSLRTTGGNANPGNLSTDSYEESSDFETGYSFPDVNLGVKGPAKSSEGDVVSFSIYKNATGSGYYVLLPPDQQIPVIGPASIQVLMGSVTVNGFHMRPSEEWHTLYSPNIASLLTLQTPPLHFLSLDVFDQVQVTIDEELKEGFFKELKNNSTVLHVKRNDDLVCRYVRHYKPFARIFSQPGFSKTVPPHMEGAFTDLRFSLCCNTIHPQERLPSSMTKRAGYDSAISQIFNAVNKHPRPVVATCGSQGTGKSTFCRYLINRLLGSIDGVCFLEADLGQTEFTPSCILSLHHVTKPLLGLPFTHLQEPIKSHFYGASDPQRDPSLYLQMVASLHRFYSQNFKDKPLIINTSGWTTDMGAALLKDILHLSSPSNLVVLHKECHQNPLEFLDSARWSEQCPSLHLELREFTPEITSILCPDHGNLFGPKSSFKRSLSLLSYFSKLQLPLPHQSVPVPIVSIVPYTVPWTAVAVHVAHTNVPFRHIMYALNASVVGLCTVDPRKMVGYEGCVSEDGFPKMLKTTPVCDCLGLGIIRGIDPEHKLFYIITPVPEDSVKNVNALIKGNHRLISDVALEGFEENEVPYFINSSKSGVPGAQPAKNRKYLIRHAASAERLGQSGATH